MAALALGRRLGPLSLASGTELEALLGHLLAAAIVERRAGLCIDQHCVAVAGVERAQ